ncbi:MAG TPA: PaaI family thioesterase [Rubrivivax sp.]|nr:PaaI family thioesterase [Rubrivivax sp.]
MTPASDTPPLAAAAIPEGFRARNFGDGFIGVNGPLYMKRLQPGVQLGFRVEPRHCNPMGICHGGMMATFCDMLLPISAHYLSGDLAKRFLPTISLQVDFLGPTPLGSWVQGEAQLLRATRSMVFMQGLVTADGTHVARVSGIFKIGPSFEDALGPGAARRAGRVPEPPPG